MPGIRRIRLELLAELENLVIHGAGRRIRIISPDLDEERISREDPFSLLGEELQELEFMSCEDHRPATAVNGHLVEVDFTVGEPVDAGKSRLALTPDCGVDPGGKLPRTEGLSDVVV